MRSGNRWIVAALALLPVTACGMIDGRDDRRPRVAASSPADAGYDALPEAPLAPEASHDAAPPLIPAPMRVAPSGEEYSFLGDPYMIDGTRYVPADVPTLDEVGYAALLPAEAGQTAAGREAYALDAIVAAHRTLPLPSYVEVTSIETGRTILVRVVDRGPMRNDRIIALSPGAARQLGLASDALAGVRVRKVNPMEQDRRILRSGGQAAARLETPPGLRMALARKLPPKPQPLTTARVAPVLKHAAPPAKPAPAATVAPLVADTQVVDSRDAAPETRLVRPIRTAAAPKALATPAPARTAPAQAAAAPAKRGGYVVQVAALSSRARADALAQSVSGYVTPVGALFRVRAGPFASDASARAALRRIHGKGYAEARVMANDAR